MIKIMNAQLLDCQIRLLDYDSLLVEGAKLYNAVPKEIRAYDKSYLGFKNLIDTWLR